MHANPSDSDKNKTEAQNDFSVNKISRSKNRRNKIQKYQFNWNLLFLNDFLCLSSCDAQCTEVADWLNRPIRNEIEKKKKKNFTLHKRQQKRKKKTHIGELNTKTHSGRCARHSHSNRRTIHMHTCVFSLWASCLTQAQRMQRWKTESRLYSDSQSNQRPTKPYPYSFQSLSRTRSRPLSVDLSLARSHIQSVIVPCVCVGTV